MHSYIQYTKSLIKARDGEKTNYSVGSFSCGTSFINDEVYLPWDSFTANAKDGRLPRCKEVDWAGLQRVAGVMHLLCKVKRVMHIDRVGCWCNESTEVQTLGVIRIQLQYQYFEQV